MHYKVTGNRGERGISLLETVLVVAVLTIVVTAALPGLGEARRAAALAGASRQRS